MLRRFAPRHIASVRARAALLATVALGVVGVAAGCARQGAPTGGPEDRRPPVVVRTVPAPLAIVDDLNTEIRFEFDERVSERVSGGGLETAVTVSPRHGVVRVGHERRALTVRVEGGLAPNVVYRVTLQPVVSDLFNNALADPFELVFSTGAQPVATTLAGEVWNRTTGQPLARATVFAVSPGGLVHQSTTDRDGIFAFRYLPAGPLSVTAFEDVNRNAEVDSTEAQGGLSVEIATGDTLLVDVPILVPDSSAAVVSKATALDSVTVVVEFDDYLEPAEPASALRVTLGRAGGVAPAARRILHEAEYARYARAVTDSLARLDSIAAARAAEAPPADSAARADTLRARADTLRAGVDTLPPPPDTVRVGRVGAPTSRRSTPRGAPTALPPLQGTRPGTTADGRRELPARRVVVLLDGPLEIGAPYEVSVEGAVNVNGLGGGGGRAPLVLEAPADSAGVRVPGDTMRVDTMRVDTMRVDTMRVDTMVVDTMRMDTTRVATSR